MRKVVWLLHRALSSLSWPRRRAAFTHLVLPGETLAQLASRIVRRPKLEYVIAGAERARRDRRERDRPGMRLEIPAPLTTT